MYKDLIRNFLKRIPFLRFIVYKIRFTLCLKSQYQKYDIYSLEDYISLFSPSLEVLKNNKRSGVATLKFYPDYKQEIHEFDLPDLKLISINNAIIIGGSNIILDDKGNALYNEAVGLNENNLDPALQTGYMRYPTIGKSTYVRSITRNSINIYSGVSLIITYPKNYYHFTHEVLAKLWALTKFNIPKTIPLIINSGIREIPQFRELLTVFNGDNRPIIEIGGYERVKVNELYVISPIKILNGVPKHWKDVSNKYPIFNFDALHFIRKKVLEKIENRESGYPERIFISRRNFKLRSYNEEEIESILKEKGFQTIYPEALSIWEQIRIFNSAKVIVAGSGAALTNVLYCKRNTNIIVFINKILSMPFYSSIAYHLGCNMVYIAADKVENPEEYHSAIHINPNDLKSVLFDLKIS